MAKCIGEYYVILSPKLNDEDWDRLVPLTFRFDELALAYALSFKCLQEMKKNKIYHFEDFQCLQYIVKK